MVKTFKQMVEFDSSFITPKEDIYINPQKFNWGQIDISDVNFDNITEVFDIKNNEYFYKTAIPFQMMGNFNSTIFKRLDNDKEVDLESLFDNLVNKPDDMILFQIAYPNKYFHSSNILMIIDKYEYESLTLEQKEFYITINAYINLILKKCEKRTWKSIEESPPIDNITLHWVWFRKNEYKLTQRVETCVKTWLDMNSEMQFSFWTDIVDETELDDFLSLCDESFKNEFKTRVKIMYLEDILEFLNIYFESYKDREAIKKFNKEIFIKLIKDREYNKTLIAKTDYLRGMILHHFGGMYADFNDCCCMIPIKYWFHELIRKQPFILPCDTFNEKQISNFFLYVPKGSQEFRKLHFEVLDGFKGILKCFKDSTTPSKIANLYIPYIKKYWKKLKQTRTNNPIQVLIDQMFSVYDSERFLSVIRDTITNDAVKGIKESDIRGKMFFPIYILKYIANKLNNESLKEFTDYISDEFKLINTIQLPRAPIKFNNNGQIKSGGHIETGKRVEIRYFSPGYKEDWDDYDELMEHYEVILKAFDDLINDENFHTEIYEKFIKNMTMIVLNMTNFILKINRELSFKELIPLCFTVINMTHISLIGHLGDGTCIGIQ
jgi:hypothetical protein